MNKSSIRKSNFIKTLKTNVCSEMDCSSKKLIPSKIETRGKIVAIGDIHGDFRSLVSILKHAKLINNDKKWIGKNSVVVFLGDLIDYCRPTGTRTCDPRKDLVNGDNSEEMKIINLLLKLQPQARKRGGWVIPLLGNHEIMNFLQEFNYVSPQGKDDFKRYGGRYKAFTLGSKFAKLVAKTHNLVVQVNGYIFSHAGILPEASELFDIEHLNLTARGWLSGVIPTKSQAVSNLLLHEKTSPLWHRRYGYGKVNCTSLSRALKNWDAKGMIVGHTVQDDINSKCEKRLWRIDVGLSRGFEMVDNPLQYLLIENKERSVPKKITIGRKK